MTEVRLYDYHKYNTCVHTMSLDQLKAHLEEIDSPSNYNLVDLLEDDHSLQSEYKYDIDEWIRCQVEPYYRMCLENVLADHYNNGAAVLIRSEDNISKALFNFCHLKKQFKEMSRRDLQKLSRQARLKEN